jgi:hypothetical protein
MKILAIQMFNGQLHAIMSEGDPIKVGDIEGNPAPGKTVHYDGIGYAVGSPTMEACEI